MVLSAKIQAALVRKFAAKRHAASIVPPVTTPHPAPIAAGLAVQARDTGRVLMLQRALDPNDPAAGHWEMPGGRLDPGEQPLDAARREWSEEVGQPIPDGEQGPGWLSSNGKYAGYVWLVSSEDAVHINADEPHVVNPDADPDGDSSETVAWWHPTQLLDNPAIRPELAADIRPVVGVLCINGVPHMRAFAAKVKAEKMKAAAAHSPAGHVYNELKAKHGSMPRAQKVAILLRKMRKREGGRIPKTGTRASAKMAGPGHFVTHAELRHLSTEAIAKHAACAVVKTAKMDGAVSSPIGATAGGTPYMTGRAVKPAASRGKRSHAVSSVRFSAAVTRFAASLARSPVFQSFASWIQPLPRPDLSSLPPRPVFAIGEHKGKVYTQQDLQNIIDAYVPTLADVKPCLMIGHDEEQLLARKLASETGLPFNEQEKSFGFPALGSVLQPAFNVEYVNRASGQTILANTEIWSGFSNIPGWFRELLDSLAYPNCSALLWRDFQCSDGKTYPLVLARVAVLGSEPPEVRGMAPLVEHFSADVITLETTPNAVAFGSRPIKQEVVPLSSLSGGLSFMGMENAYSGTAAPPPAGAVAADAGANMQAMLAELVKSNQMMAQSNQALADQVKALCQTLSDAAEPDGDEVPGSTTDQSANGASAMDADMPAMGAAMGAGKMAAMDAPVAAAPMPAAMAAPVVADHAAAPAAAACPVPAEAATPAGGTVIHNHAPGGIVAGNHPAPAPAAAPEKGKPVAEKHSAEVVTKTPNEIALEAKLAAQDASIQQLLARAARADAEAGLAARRSESAQFSAAFTVPQNYCMTPDEAAEIAQVDALLSNQADERFSTSAGPASVQSRFRDILKKHVKPIVQPVMFGNVPMQTQLPIMQHAGAESFSAKIETQAQVISREKGISIEAAKLEAVDKMMSPGVAMSMVAGAGAAFGQNQPMLPGMIPSNGQNGHGH